MKIPHQLGLRTSIIGHTHFYHAGLFYEFGEKNMSGGYVRIWMIDQWHGKSVDKRYKLAYTPDEAKRKGVHPCDNANEFYVVIT
jgi:hypothetical protein